MSFKIELSEELVNKLYAFHGVEAVKSAVDMASDVMMEEINSMIEINLGKDGFYDSIREDVIKNENLKKEKVKDIFSKNMV